MPDVPLTAVEQHGLLLKEYDTRIRNLTASGENYARGQRRQDRQIDELKLDLQGLSKSHQTVQETQRIVLETQKSIYSKLSEQTQHTKIISDIFTAGSMLKKLIIGLAVVITSLGAIIGGVVYSLNVLLRLPL